MSAEPCVTTHSELKKVLEDIRVQSVSTRWAIQPVAKWHAEPGPSFDQRAQIVLGWLIKLETPHVDLAPGRWWYIPVGATNSFVVLTCWQGIEEVAQKTLLHRFQYKGVAIFDPEIAVDEFEQVAKLHEIMVRKEGSS